MTRGDLREVVSVLAVAAAYAVFARLEHSRTLAVLGRFDTPPGGTTAERAAGAET